MDVGPGMGARAQDARHVAVPVVGEDAPSGLFRSKKGRPGGRAGASASRHPAGTTARLSFLTRL